MTAVYDEALAPTGINIAQFFLLRRIQKRERISMSELAKVAELDRSTVGRNVRVLERMSLVGTEQGDADRREAIVYLTEKGAEALDLADPIWRATQSKMEDKLGRERAELLRDVLNLL